MFGYFQFGQPQFADAPAFGGAPAPASGGGGASPSRRHFHKNFHELTRKEQESQMEKILMAFLDNQ